jgi:hypothetical protein
MTSALLSHSQPRFVFIPLISLPNRLRQVIGELWDEECIPLVGEVLFSACQMFFGFILTASVLFGFLDVTQIPLSEHILSRFRGDASVSDILSQLMFRSWFKSADQLSTLTFESDSRLSTLGEFAFSFCGSLQSIFDIPVIGSDNSEILFRLLPCLLHVGFEPDCNISGFGAFPHFNSGVFPASIQINSPTSFRSSQKRASIILETGWTISPRSLSDLGRVCDAPLTWRRSFEYETLSLETPAPMPRDRDAWPPASGRPRHVVGESKSIIWKPNLPPICRSAPNYSTLSDFLQTADSYQVFSSLMLIDLHFHIEFSRD